MVHRHQYRQPDDEGGCQHANHQSIGDTLEVARQWREYALLQAYWHLATFHVTDQSPKLSRELRPQPEQIIARRPNLAYPLFRRVLTLDELLGIGNKHSRELEGGIEQRPQALVHEHRLEQQAQIRRQP